MDQRKNNGGHSTKGKAGRPAKAVEDQANTIIRNAIRELYKKDTDEAAQVAFVKDFATTPRGMQFVAEHLFGKAPQIIEGESKLVVTDLTNVSTQTLLQLEKEMNANED
mgnify:CR=1 FL=1